MNIAVLLAGGSGKRLGGELPKQFIKVGGKMIIEHTLDAFERCAAIDEIAVVVRKDCIDDVRHIVEKGGYTKVGKILCGGRERYHSSLAAIETYRDDNDTILFHDAVRPLVSQRIITDCVAAMQSHEAVAVAVSSTDTIFEVDERGCIANIPPRSTLRRAQTPQCFHRGLIKKAYDIALQDKYFSATDDCGVVRHYLPDVPIYIVEGEPTNIKVTYKEDLAMMETLLHTRGQ